MPASMDWTHSAAVASAQHFAPPMALSFRIGKVPVKILPSFFLVTFLLNLGISTLSELVLWALIVFGSVVAHELGHATMALAFGLEPHIQLHGMGGTTAWAASRNLSVSQRIAVSLAGPAAGFLVAAGVRWGLPPSWFESDLGAVVYRDLLFVNFGWGVLNLLPMLPLDGGSVMAQLLGAVTHGRGEKPARIVSIAVAATAALLALGVRWWWRGLTALKAAEHDAPMREALEAAYAALDAKNAARVLELARPVALQARTMPVRAEALQLLAFGFLHDGRLADADAALAAMPAGYAPHASLLALREQVAQGRAEPEPTALH